ncbi:ABC transporter substrate-binding protein [Pseudomonas huaxiensis]|uniref:ABC transporter substrate-binding protein n=1 Tax=Pseudomonas huaxiensis TaxID=2213017 RepID=UPI000DA6C12C|nr:ABC transporter substrate-binding protein [Pseudomonas huaxiensis]
MRLTSLFAALLGAGVLVHSPLGMTDGNKGNLVFCSEGSPSGFDSAQYQSGTDNDVAEPLYNRLVEFERGATGVLPALATDWSISDDGLIYTFNLRPGVKFHSNKGFTPSRDFNADDVLFTFNRMLNTTHPFRMAYGTEFPYFSAMGLDKTIAKVEKTGPMTVVFTLNQVDASLIQNLAMSFASILSAEYAEQLLSRGTPADISHKPIGTGPFVFNRYQKDAQVRYRGNPDYWAPEKVKLDTLIFSINTDPSVRVQKLRKGECQVTIHPRPADLEALRRDETINLIEKPAYNLGYIAYNTQKKPFDQLEVRQALDMAVDKEAIIRTVFQGAGQVAANSMPPTQWSYDETIADPPHDLEKARQMLRDAGVKEGTEITLWAMPVQRPYNPNAKLMAQMLQDDWGKLGLKVKIVSYEWGEYLKRAKDGEHDTILIGWTGDNGDPDNWLGTLYSCDAIGSHNHSMWCDPQYDALVKQAKSVTDREQRSELYRQAQHYLKQQVPITPVAHSTVSQPVSTKVKDYLVSPFGRTTFLDVGIE